MVSNPSKPWQFSIGDRGDFTQLSVLSTLTNQSPVDRTTKSKHPVVCINGAKIASSCVYN
jgi:hypothetical protein